ncbi:DUF4249 domain-containing protein [Carboxylicivirga sp. RSCT41]|uniref:DUF4249 domain-containing protein n=1 Tax=Carboxylicivirga agarovorans TaxID=3417570 RepID=UPI003D34C554
MLRNTLLLVMLLGTLSSCEKEIEYKGKELNNFLVLNAKLTEGETIRIELTRSNTIFENKAIKTIGDADVQLFIDGEYVETLQAYNFFKDAPNYNQEHYSGEAYYYLYNTESVKAGSTYTIKIKHSDYNDISASTQVPSKADAWIKNIESENGNLNYTVAIKDEPGKNFYRLRVKGCYDYQTINGVNETGCTYLGYHSVSTKDPVLSFNRIIDEDSFTDYPDNVYLLFDDELFDGETYELKFSIRGEKTDDADIEIIQLDENLYRYYNTVQMRDYYEDYAFSEPVRVYSNIKGGAGVLGSNNSHLMTLENHN